MSENALVDVSLPELKLAQAGRVDEDRAAGKDEQLAVTRDVPAAAVAPQVARPHQLAPGERVDERRLADARRAEQRERLRRLRGIPHLVEPLAVSCSTASTGTPMAVGLGFRDLLVVLADVELRQHDDGLCARLPRRDEIPLEPAGVEVSVEAGDEEHRVDVRDERVLLGLQPGRLARDLRAARQHGFDRGRGRPARRRRPPSRRQRACHR